MAARVQKRVSTTNSRRRNPKIAGRCDRCEGKILQREDDRPESIEVRLEAYERSTAPLIAFYQNLGLLIEVVAKGSPDAICERTLTELHVRHAGQPSSVGAIE